ncbi:MAG: hypothetical protein E7333_04480 [Clostridiales bacterium]|nr:hypothetical protein [Clostridiales bacterium]
MIRLLLMALLILLMLLPTLPAFAGEYEPLPLKDKTDYTWLYQNPLRGDVADPFIVPYEGRYYCFSTGGHRFDVKYTTRFRRWKTASSLTALRGTAWSTQHHWAPEVYQYNGKWVMLFSAQMGADYDLRVSMAFADKITGPYTDPGDKPFLDPGYNVIDASLFVDDDGTPYLLFVRDCSENYVGFYQCSHTYGVRLTEDLSAMVGEPVCLTVPDTPWEKKSSPVLWNEGVFIRKHDGKYYLYYSANAYNTGDYAVGVAVSDAPLGPYVKQANNPILTQVTDENGKRLVCGVGHNAFFTVGEELFTAYHCSTDPIHPSAARSLCIDRAGYHADGTAFINGPTLAKQLVPLADLGLTDLTPAAALSAGERGELLRDGDYCIADSSADYLWHGASVTLTWDEPVIASLIQIYPQGGEKATGRLILNDAWQINVDFSALEALPGVHIVLHFDDLAITSLRLELDAEAALGEVRVIGPAQ